MVNSPKKTKSTTDLNSSGVTKKKSLRKEARAGINISIAKVAKILAKNALHTERVGAGAAVWAAAVVDYVAREIIEAAARSVQEIGSKKRIYPRDINMAIRNDPDLSRLFAGTRVLVGDKLRICADDVTANTDSKFNAALAEVEATA